MHIYQRYDGKFILVAGDQTSDEYEAGDNEMEARIMENKVLYATKVREAATRLAQVAEEMERLEEIWNDRLYGVGLANEITDIDLQPVGLTQNQLVAVVNLAGQLRAFLEGEPIFAGNYNVSLNQARTDV